MDFTKVLLFSISNQLHVGRYTWILYKAVFCFYIPMYGQQVMNVNIVRIIYIIIRGIYTL